MYVCAMRTMTDRIRTRHERLPEAYLRSISGRKRAGRVVLGISATKTTDRESSGIHDKARLTILHSTDGRITKRAIESAAQALFRLNETSECLAPAGDETYF